MARVNYACPVRFSMGGLVRGACGVNQCHAHTRALAIEHACWTTGKATSLADIVI